jgi:type 1 fimbriae regulatory protein FimB
MKANSRPDKPALGTILQRVTKNPRRMTDEDYGRADRKYLRPAEVELLIRAARAGRHGARDALMISVAFHHALRVTELVGLEWDSLDLKAGTIDVARQKGGVDGKQHLAPADARALRALRSKADGNRYVFVSERGGGLTRDAFAKILQAAADRAGIDRRLAHPHALRHAAGHALANSGRVNEYQLQAVMGHKDPRSTRVYVQGVAGFIKGLWD